MKYWKIESSSLAHPYIVKYVQTEYAIDVRELLKQQYPEFWWNLRISEYKP